MQKTETLCFYVLLPNYGLCIPKNKNNSLKKNVGDETDGKINTLIPLF